MTFIVVPTSYIVYKVINEEIYTLIRVIECKTKGAAVEWIHKSGEKGVNYCIKEFLRKSK